jgi:glycerophosphoryl diester phosphodiesterase
VPTPKIIAHRGGREWAPENTLSAFRRSLEFGAYGIELDIQRCASGELVVFHDEELSRTTNGAGLLKDCSLDELRRLSAGHWFDPSFKDERVPLLVEVLDLVGGGIVINIELKNTPFEYPGMVFDLLELVADYPRPDQLIFSSFDHKVMKELHEQAPQLKIALLGAAVFVDLKQTAEAIGAHYLHPSYDCFRPDIAQEAHRAGLEVNVWTCNLQREWRDCLRMGVEGIITDDPEGLKEFLQIAQSGTSSVLDLA